MTKSAIHRKCAALAALALGIWLLPALANAQPAEETVPITLSCPSALLMEASTGRVIFEKNADERRPVASVTKVMTILLTLEAIDQGQLTLDTMVTVSPAAASMGGSQALLDAGSRYSVRQLLSSMIIASANDSAVALAEAISGAQEAFVAKMNTRAEELGLADTHYVNCTGLPAQGHYTTARDVATLSRQLDLHPLYYEFSTVWMQDLVHPGGRITGLTNTNRLVRFYPGCDGYKTGSTNEARYCISATAKKDGMRLIAVVLGAQAGQTRFDEARAMLEYGFANYKLASPLREGQALDMEIPVRLGSRDTVGVVSGGACGLLLRKGEAEELSLEAALCERLTAPVRAGDVVGEIRVRRGGEVIASVPAVAAQDVPLPGFVASLLRIRKGFLMGGGR